MKEIYEKLKEKFCSDYKLLKFTPGLKYRHGDIVKYEVEGEEQRFVCIISQWCSDKDFGPPGSAFGSFHWRELKPNVSWAFHFDTFDREHMYSEGDKVIYNQVNFVCVEDYDPDMEIAEMNPMSMSGSQFWRHDKDAPPVQNTLECTDDGKVKANGEEITVKPSIKSMYESALPGDPDFVEGATADDATTETEALAEYNNLTAEYIPEIEEHSDFRFVNGEIDFSVIDPEFDELRHSAKPLPADDDSITSGSYTEFENVTRITRVLSEQGFLHIFSLASGEFTFENFTKAAARFPNFCDSNPENSSLTMDQMCAKELSTLFAHIIQETGKNDPTDTNLQEWRQGMFKMIPDGCPNDAACISHDAPEDEYFPTTDGVKYYNRSPLQVSDNRLIGRFSESFAGENEDYLADPSVLENDGYVSFGFALWMYMTVHHPNPSVHYVVTGQWEPNLIDKNAGANLGFGMTTMILKGSEECGATGNSANAARRYDYFLSLVDYFGIPYDTTTGGTCLQIQSLTEGGSSFMNLYWDQDTSVDPDAGIECHRVSWITPWSTLVDGAYETCVEESEQYYIADNGFDTTDGTADPSATPVTPDTHDPYPGKYTVDPTDLSLTIVDPTIQAIVDSAKTMPGSDEPTIDTTALTSEPENVKRAAKVLTEEKWNELTPKKLKNFTYKAFLQNVKKNPMFCGESKRTTDAMTPLEVENKLTETCGREISALMAHLVEESGSPTTKDLTERYKFSLMRKSESGCPDEPRCWDYTNWKSQGYPPSEEVTYHGRGALQLKGNYAYGVYSNRYLGSKHYLLQNPDMIEESDFLLLGTMFNKYMTPNFPRPSMHDVMVGNWTPDADATAAGLVGPFAVTSVIMGGDKFCGWGNIESRQDIYRKGNYENLLKVFNLTILPGEITSCANSKPFSKQMAGIPKLNFEQDWEKNIPTCKATKNKTQFSVLDANGWENCLKYANDEDFDASKNNFTLYIIFTFYFFYYKILTLSS